MNKGALLVKLAQDVRASYWFIPALLVIAALVLAQALHWLDRNADILPNAAQTAFISFDVTGARSTLTVIATSMIGVAGVMFSMTFVAVSFAAGNYGPRLIGNFMRNRGNQISLGILIATFVYALSTLRVLQDPTGGSAAFVPHSAMQVALLLCLVSVGAMIFFVHHVPETINVSNITADLGQRLCAEIGALIDADAARDDQPDMNQSDAAPDHEVTLAGAGYIQTLNYERFEALCARDIWTLRIEQQPGDFVSPFTPVVSIWSDALLHEHDLAQLRECFALGNRKTENQNVLFLVDQLVEMLARAMSPGVNDPFTAINCMNWMHNALDVARHHGDGLGPEGAGRYAHGPRLTYGILFERSFVTARPYCEGDALCKAHYDKLVSGLRPAA